VRFGTTLVDEILTALDRQLGLARAGRHELVVCGGSALAALGLVTRTTRDVDVLGTAEVSAAGLRVLRLRELPAEVRAAAARVARDFGLDEDWLNLGPAAQLDLGLPEGFGGRLVRRGYGEHLTVYFAGRYDQIHFKLDAAADQDDYHVQDLAALGPADEELLAAARWALTQDVSAEFRRSLGDFLTHEGHDHVARSL